MWAVYTVAVLVTMFFVWQMNARRMEALERGWFVRNWLSCIVAGLVGFVQILLFSADWWLWNAAGVLITFSVLSTRFSPSDPKPAAAEPHSRTSSPSNGEPPPIVKGKVLDTVRFDYVSAKGEYTSRRVTVQMIGEWQFEGIDLDKGEERTFRYERVVGGVTSEKAGLTLSPLEWAESFR